MTKAGDEILKGAKEALEMQLEARYGDDECCGGGCHEDEVEIEVDINTFADNYFLTVTDGTAVKEDVLKSNDITFNGQGWSLTMHGDGTVTSEGTKWGELEDIIVDTFERANKRINND